MKNSSVSIVLVGFLSLMLSACGGGSGGGSSGSGSGGGTPVSTAAISVDVTGLSSGGSVTVQGGISSSSEQTVTATSNGVVDFPQQFQTNDSFGANYTVRFSITSQPTNGEQCLLLTPQSTSNDSSGTWSFSPNQVSVSCSAPVKATAYQQLGPFQGIAKAQVIASPKVVPVFLSGAANENTDLTFLQQLVVSQYWGALSEYGIGNGVVESALYPTAPVSFTGSVDDTQIRTAIQTNNAWGATLDPSTVLAVFLPAGVTYTAMTNEGEPYDAGAEHGQVTVNGVNIQFITIPTISGGSETTETAEYLIDAVSNPGGGGPNMAASLGYVEASINPDTYSGSHYYDPQGSFSYPDHLGQEFVELGNACDAMAPSESDLTLPNGSFLLAIFSNATAAQDYAAGNYGYCQPAFGEAVDYASSAAAQSVTATRFGHTFTDQALVVAPGASTAVTVTAWGQNQANGTTNPWSLTVNPEVYYTSGTAAPVDCSAGTPDYESFLVPAACSNAPVVSVSPNGSASVANGDTFKVTVTMPSASEPGLWSILLSGTDGGTEQPILVTNASTWQ